MQHQAWSHNTGGRTPTDRTQMRLFGEHCTLRLACWAPGFISWASRRVRHLTLCKISCDPGYFEKHHLVSKLGWHRITRIQTNLDLFIFNISTVPVDGLAPLGARASAVTVLAELGTPIYTGPAFKGLKPSDSMNSWEQCQPGPSCV